MDKTMEEVIGRPLLISRDNVPDYLREIYLKADMVRAMKEWETLTSKSRDEEISKLKKGIVNDLRPSIEELIPDHVKALELKSKQQFQEIERLKGLLKSHFIAYNKSVMYENQINMAWMDFEKENNL